MPKLLSLEPLSEYPSEVRDLFPDLEAEERSHIKLHESLKSREKLEESQSPPTEAVALEVAHGKQRHFWQRLEDKFDNLGLGVDRISGKISPARLPSDPENITYQKCWAATLNTSKCLSSY